MTENTAAKTLRSPLAAVRHEPAPTGQAAIETRPHPAQRGREANATARVVFRCAAILHDSIKAIAARNGVNMSEAIRLMLTAYVGNDGGRSSDLVRLSKSLRPLSRARGTSPRKTLP
jgi:hypothetical protein